MRVTDSALKKLNIKNKKVYEDFLIKAKFTLEKNWIELTYLEKKEEDLRIILDKMQTSQKAEDVWTIKELEIVESELTKEIDSLKKGIEKKLNKDFTLNNLFNEYISYKKKVRYLNEFLSNISKKIETFEE